MASIVLFSPYEDIAKERERIYTGRGHDVFSYPVFLNFCATFNSLPSIDLIVTGMKFMDARGGDHIIRLRTHAMFNNRFTETPIIAHSVERYPADYVQGLGVTEFISFPDLPGSGFEAVDAAVRRYVPDVPSRQGKLAIYNPSRPGSLVR